MIYKCLDIVFKIFTFLPRQACLYFGRALGWFLLHVIRFRISYVREHLQRAFPEYTAQEQRKLLRSVYSHLGLLLPEMLQIPALSSDQILDRTSFTNENYLSEALQQGKGALVLAAHTGNWEMGLAASGERFGGVLAVTKEIKGNVGQYIADRMRNPHNVNQVPRRNSIRTMLRALRDNAILGFVLDQNTARSEGVFVDFMGQNACTMPGLATIAKRTGAPVIPVAFHRTDIDHHNVTFYPPVEWPNYLPEGWEDEIHYQTQVYTKKIEEMIREHPAQWLWIHRRWRNQPEARF